MYIFLEASRIGVHWFKTNPFLFCHSNISISPSKPPLLSQHYQHQNTNIISTATNTTPTMNRLWEFIVNISPFVCVGYMAGSKERKELEGALERHASRVADIPIMIGDKEYRTDLVQHQPMPHKHSHKWVIHPLSEQLLVFPVRPKLHTYG